MGLLLKKGPCLSSFEQQVYTFAVSRDINQTILSMVKGTAIDHFVIIMKKENILKIALHTIISGMLSKENIMIFDLYCLVSKEYGSKCISKINSTLILNG